MSVHYFPSGLAANPTNPPGIICTPNPNTRSFTNPLDISHVPARSEVPDEDPHILLSIPRHSSVDVTDIRLRVSLTDDDEVSALPINFPKRSDTAEVDASLIPSWNTHVRMGPAVGYFLRRAVDASLAHLPGYHRSSRRKFIEDTSVLLGHVLLQGHAWYAIAIGPATGVTRASWDLMKPLLTDGSSVWMAFRTEGEAHEWLKAVQYQLGFIRPATNADAQAQVPV